MSEQTTKEMNGGGRTTTRPHPSFFPTLTSSLIVILMLISLFHNTTSDIKCYDGGATTWDNINDIDINKIYINENKNEFCLMMYVIEEFEELRKPYTYGMFGTSSFVRVGSTDEKGIVYKYPVNVLWEPKCDADKRCQMRSIQLDGVEYQAFVCCCNTPLCNNPIADLEMNPRVQYEKQLKENGAQACFVRNDKSAIQDCTRISNQKETPNTLTRCLSVRKPNGEQVLGCAHDGTIDRCDGVMNQNGSCRISQSTNNMECCCEGAYCNDEAYMNLTCRHSYINSSNFQYGGGGCAAPLPSTTTEMTTAQTSSTDITTTDNNSDTVAPLSLTPFSFSSAVFLSIKWMIAALSVCASALLLVFCVLVFTCVVCCLQRKYLKQAGRKDTTDDDPVGVSTTASVCPSKSMTPSEKLDAEPPRIMIGEHEDEANVRAMGPQSNENSMTMAGVVSNWGSVHTVLPPPPQPS